MRGTEIICVLIVILCGMSENTVTIKGNKYKYTYVDGETKYLGPVGDAPPISEEEFLRVLSTQKTRKLQWSGQYIGGTHGMESNALSEEEISKREHELTRYELYEKRILNISSWPIDLPQIMQFFGAMIGPLIPIILGYLF